MELSVTKSRLHLALIIGCFGIGFLMVGFSGLPFWIKAVCFVALMFTLLSELKSWWHVPQTISLRREKLFFHSAAKSAVNDVANKGTANTMPPNTESFELARGRAHPYWIALSKRKFRPAICLFRDSFSRADWAALQRAIRN